MDKEVKELEKALEQIWDIATNKFGLDPFPTHFEIVPAAVMYEIGSYALPGRYSHWTFGKAYHKMKTMYDFGLSKIYEVVINSNPAYAFLLENNSLIQNKLVIAHVLGHVDFFKNNVYFSQTNRRMVDDAAMHARRINEYEFKYGRKVVEQFLDAVLSIEEHVDPNFFIKRRREEKKTEQPKHQVEGRYDDLFSLEKRSAPQPTEEGKAGEQKMEPEKDVVYFIMQNSPILEPWQRDLMSMIHDEMLYFVPQMQTKILNEGWACLRGDSLVLTEQGFIRFDQLYSSGEKIGVAGGGAGQVYRITDFHKEERVPTIRIRTRRGLTLEGALKHRVLLADGSWAYLKDLKLGERIAIECGTNVWPRRKQPLNFELPSSRVMQAGGVALTRAAAGLATSSLSAMQPATRVSGMWQSHQPTPARQGLLTRTPLRTSGFLDEEIAWIAGYFIGNGHRTGSGICFTCGDQALAAKLRERIEEAFGLCATLQWGSTEGCRVYVESRNLLDLLYSLGIELQDTAPSKKLPPPILRSPKEVMSAFLRGYFDADADVGSAGISLSSSSEELIRTIQIVLLNYGILSSQQPQRDGGIQLSLFGASAARFLDEIGFSLPCKQQALREYVKMQQRFKKEELADEIVSIEPGCGAVFDITVETKHTYVANGMLHHNSFWHARIMRELDLPTADHLEFAELHAGVVSPHKGQLNPYYLGYKILEDIERRWDNPTPEEREKFGRQGGEGRAKLFEVRELDNDVSLLRNYLTEELCEELDLFVYELVDDEEWTVTEKQWERVRDQLVANMTNFGFPYIEVVDGDYDRNRELYLRHRYEGVELDLKYARKVLEYLYQLWGRPVHLETQVDNEPLVMHFDGEDHDEN